MKRFIITSDDFSSVEDIGIKYPITKIDYYNNDGTNYLSIQLHIIIGNRDLIEKKLKYIFSNKNRFILIDGDRAYCYESKNKFYYKDRGLRWLYDLYLEDVKVNEIDGNFVNVLSSILG